MHFRVVHTGIHQDASANVIGPLAGPTSIGDGKSVDGGAGSYANALERGVAVNDSGMVFPVAVRPDRVRNITWESAEDADRFIDKDCCLQAAGTFADPDGAPVEYIATGDGIGYARKCIRPARSVLGTCCKGIHVYNGCKAFTGQPHNQFRAGDILGVGEDAEFCIDLAGCLRSETDCDDLRLAGCQGKRHARCREIVIRGI